MTETFSQAQKDGFTLALKNLNVLCIGAPGASCQLRVAIVNLLATGAGKSYCAKVIAIAKRALGVGCLIYPYLFTSFLCSFSFFLLKEQLLALSSAHTQMSKSTDELITERGGKNTSNA